MVTTERSSKVAETIEQAVQSLFQTLASSYGPRGMDKMLVQGKETVITNDGATIMGYYKAHPIHRILSSVSATQDANCGDGTTSVILLIGSIMEQVWRLRRAGVHASRIVEGLEIAKKLGLKYIEEAKVKIGDDEFLKVAMTTLSSKIASKSQKMAQVAVEALKRSKKEEIRIVKKVGGDIDDVELVNGVLLDRTGVEAGEKRVLLVQFCLSSPKTNLDSKVLINDYSLMEKFVKEEREYVVKLIRKIKATGATLLVIQKSLVRESCSELAMHFLKKVGISVIDGVDRKDIEMLSRALSVAPVTDADLLVAPVAVDVEQVRGLLCLRGVGTSILVSGCDGLVVAEAERSLNDALCVVKCLLDEPYIVAGGGSVEAGIAAVLDGQVGPRSVVLRELSQGFLGLPRLLAQNAGLAAVEVVSNLRKNIEINRHYGVSMRTGMIGDMVNDEGVVQPAVVTKSIAVLAIETVQMLVRVDDLLPRVN